MCRPLPASNPLSKSTSLGSAGRLHPQPAQPNVLDEGQDVVAEQPMQSPFGSPPPVGLPERHLGPPVQEEHVSHVAAATTTANGSLLASPAARDSSYTFASHSGSETGHGRVSNTHAPASHQFLTHNLFWLSSCKRISCTFCCSCKVLLIQCNA